MRQLSMGKIKSKLVKRTANTLIKKGIEFSETFEKNKNILENTMPSRKLRNQIAGFLSRIKKQERINQPKILKDKE
ncbi:30S ribosomal protein S17e [Candidatus Pacearchaeota archaeon]|nr:30S ribosomal protein S17e [Candidatus Pacearchaeota archaeon]